MRFQKNISLSKHTTFKIGGPAKYFYVAKNKEDLIEAIKEAKNLPVFVLGGGSNVLALDRGYRGLVIKIVDHQLERNNGAICANAGVELEEVVDLSVKSSLTGLEWAVGIPGTIGGAVYGNAQAFGTKISNIVKSVEVINRKNLKIKTLTVKQCDFSSKRSIFKKNKDLVILTVVLRLKKGDKKSIVKEIKEYSSLRKKKHPLKYPSAGSIFVNNQGTSPSSYLIEKAGLKGLKIGGAEISQEHAGFIVNTGKAKAKDVLALIKKIKKGVKSKFGAELQEEIQIIK